VLTVALTTLIDVGLGGLAVHWLIAQRVGSTGNLYGFSFNDDSLGAMSRDDEL